MKPRAYIKTLALCLAFGVASGNAAEARPATHHRGQHNSQHAPRAKAPAGKAANYAAMVVDASDGHILYERNGAARLHPASTTKVMTAYLVFEALRDGRLKWDQRINVSNNAAGQPRTNLGMMSSIPVRDGVVKGRQRSHREERQNTTSITVENAVRGMLCHSANDAAVVLAEAVGGTEANFVKMMNAKAKELGLAGTHYANPNGLPDNSQITTPEDLARLSRAVIRDFPDRYKLFDITSFTFNGATYKNTNNLLGHYDGIDGIKTGWIATSGYNLAASAKRGEERVIGVIFGARSPIERRDDMTALLDFGFKKIAHPDSVFAFGPATASDTGDRYIDIPPKPGEEDAPPVAPAPATLPAPAPTNTGFAPVSLSGSFNIIGGVSTTPMLAPLKPGNPEQPPSAPTHDPVILPQPFRFRDIKTGPAPF